VVHRWTTATDGNARDSGSLARRSISLICVRVWLVRGQAATEYAVSLGSITKPWSCSTRRISARSSGSRFPSGSRSWR